MTSLRVAQRRISPRRSKRHGTKLGAVLVTAVLLTAVVTACTGTTSVPTGSANGASGISTVPSTASSPANSGGSGGSGPASSAPPASRPSPGCSTNSPAKVVAGEATEEAVLSGGVQRMVLRKLPRAATLGTPLPLVIDLHGYIEGAKFHSAMTALDAAADRHGFVNLTPQGTSSSAYWNAGPTTDGPDDLRFLTDLVDATGASLCIDLARVYATGLSNGAMMASLAACRLGDVFAAVSMVAGLMFPLECAPNRVVPFVAFHGTEDSLLSYDQDGRSLESSGLPFTPETKHNFDAVNLQSARTGFGQWGELLGCAAVQEKDVTPSVRHAVRTGCRDGATIEFYTVAGGGHTWPGSEFSAPVSPVLGVTTREIDANDLMWAFFSRYRR